MLSWNYSVQSGGGTGMMILAGIAGLIVALITAFKPSVAPFTAPLYATLEGWVLGAISVMFEAVFLASLLKPSCPH